jgi:TRAP transporter TAXI family solute receptor
VLLASRLTGSGLQSLVDHYNTSLPHLNVTQEGTGGSVALVSAINDGHGDIGTAQADVVYAAYRRGTEDAPFPHTNLSAIAVLNIHRLYVFVRSGSGLHGIEDLRGKRVLVAERSGSASELLTRMVLKAYDISYSDMNVEFAPFEIMRQRFANGTQDAMIIVNNLDARAAAAPSDPHTVRLLPVSDRVMNVLRTDYPFVRPSLLPDNALPTQRRPVQTVEVDALVICRKDLDPDLVYELTREFFAWPEFERRFPGTFDLRATVPIPLHPGAARYYREREILR